MRIARARDFWAGILFAALGLAFALAAHGLRLGGAALLEGYAMGTPAAMGPGFFPFWLGLLLAALGVGIAVSATRGPGGGAPLERIRWRPLALVLGSVVLFGVLLRPLGLVGAGTLLVVGASLGSPGFALRRSLALAAVLVAFCALVFVAGLKLPLPLCPAVDALRGVALCRG